MSLEKRRGEEKNRVHNYVLEHPNETEDNIASALEMNIIDVLVALHTLKNEGKISELSFP